MLSLLTRRARKGPLGSLRDPALAEWLGASAPSASGQVVTPATALQASAVYACVRNTAETTAALPCVLKKVQWDDQGRRRSEEARSHPLYPVLLETPNDWQTAFDYWEMVVEHLELRGNHYSRIVTNGSGQTVALEPFHPDRVRAFWSHRRPAYEIEEDGRRKVLLADEVFHVRGPLQGDGLQGATPLKIHRETIGMALAARDYGARLFANDARPLGVLEMPVERTLDEDGFKRVKDEWQQAYGGENRHKVAILEDGLQFKHIGLSNEDAQYIETRGFTDLEIARVFRTPPYKIGILEKSTLNNVEQQNRAWVTDKLAPLARRIEDAIHRDLLTPSGRRRFAARYDFSELLRGDITTRTDHNSKGIQWGWYSPNDVRDREGLNPLGPEGDVYVSPVNMQPMMALLKAVMGTGEEAPEGGLAAAEEEEVE